jgi:nucleoside-diphosphate-sugar epimerase/intein/homing endonuclease
MTILITGGDGYIGWPTALRTAGRTDGRVVLADDFARRGWVESVGSTSATPVASMDDRLAAAEDALGLSNLSFVEGDLSDKATVDRLLSVHEPEAVVHTAAQPSAPYSQINGERANYTQHNNMQATRNLLWGLHEHDLSDTHFVETTTTGVYGCYDDETEILTKDGWKQFEDLTQVDEVLTREEDDRTGRYEVPTEIHEYSFDGELYHQQNQSIDFRITPNHRVFTQKVNSNESGDGRYGGLRERTVSDIEKKRVVYDTGFDWEGEYRDTFTLPPTDDAEAIDIPLDSWLRFLGWYIAEGYVKQRSDRPNNYRVGFSQSKESIWVSDLEDALREVGDRLGTGVEKREEDDVFRYELFNKQLAKCLDGLGKSVEKHIPKDIKQLDQPLLRTLLSALIKGDGSHRSADRDSMRYFTRSEQLADDVQEIALKCGYASVVSYTQEYDRYVVGIAQGPRVHVNRGESTDEFVAYSGKVWCVTVPGDGIVFVRRNGKPVWSGNSPDFPIPEGGAVMENQGERDEVPFPNMSGSWYHTTKSNDAANMRLANTQFDLPISDVRTAITYGTGVGETRAAPDLATRFDFDYYFGVVTHRFCAQAVAGYPMTVYGKGQQRKPFIALEDVVEGLARLAVIDPDERPDDHVVYNQVTRAISIVEVAETIADVADEFDLDVAVEHFENPREEDETHKMEIENDRYADLVGGQSTTFEEGVREILGTLVGYQDTIEAHEDRFLPGVLTEDE